MKKNYAILVSALVVASQALSVDAQQLPNSGFEKGWGDCTPWTSNGNTKTCGTTPGSWTISQVIGMSGTGATTVGEQTTGHNSDAAVKIYNSPNSVKSSQIVPGYVTLGTPWSTAKGANASNADGGTFGGIEFTYRPDAVSFYYTRSHGTANATEQATVVAYMWKGTYSQASVPGNIGLLSTKTCTMVDRDRNILGIATAQGGAIAATDDAACIAKIDYALTGDAADWTQKVIEFDYLTNDTPEKFNIIFGAGDYWSTSPGNGNTLCVDDVELLYYSRLSAVSVNGTAVASFSPDKYDYTVEAELPASADEITATLYGAGKSASYQVNLDTENSQAVITVTNDNGNDADGLNTHTYTITFAGKSTPTEPSDPSSAVSYTGSLTIEMMGSVINEGDDTEYMVYITPKGDGLCDFSLPNFSLDLGDGPTPLGDINVENVTVTDNGDDTKTYNGTKQDLSLLDGEIIADVELTGTEKADGALQMTINVIWKAGDDENIPILVTFNGQKQSTGIGSVATDDTQATVEYYNLQGIRVNNPAAGGIYIRRQGSTVSKILVK